MTGSHEAQPVSQMQIETPKMPVSKNRMGKLSLYTELLLVKALILSGCGPVLTANNVLDETPQTAAITSTIRQTETPTAIPTVIYSPTPTPTPELTEVCVVPEQTPQAPGAETTPVPEPPNTIVSQGSLEAIESMKIGAENIITPKISHEKSFRVLLVPIAYDDANFLSERFEFFTEILDFIYKDLPMEFSYLDKSVPAGVEISHNGGILTKEEELDAVVVKTREVQRFNDVYFIINSKDYLGGYGKYGIASGESGYGAFSLAHELAHGIHKYGELGLTDRYILIGHPDYMNNYIGTISTEIFTSTDVFNQDVLRVARDLNAPIVAQPYTCHGDQIYRFYEGDDIMTRTYDEAELIQIRQVGGSLFNPVQKEYIRRILPEVLDIYR